MMGNLKILAMALVHMLVFTPPEVDVVIYKNCLYTLQLPKKKKKST